ncbi:MAG: DUF308 domain-containing protein [Clostridia bacterium]|nr:DUF308 domain-containing protein [Clostridia bacterium]
MKEFFTNVWKDMTFSAILTVLAGLLITVFYSVAINFVCIAIGLAVAVLGIVCIVKYLRSAQQDNKYELLIGLIAGAIGIYIISNPAFLQNLVAVAIGIVILFHGILDCQSTAKLYRNKYKYWFIALIMSVITIGTGIALIILKNQAIQTLAVVMGIMLMVEGALNVWIAVKVKKFND